MKRVLLVLVSMSLLVGQDTVFKSSVRLVQVYANVFDHGGHAVTGLTREQFEILDDGVAQPIKLFETTDKSVSCALLLDTTGSMLETMPMLRNAAREFIGALRDGDSVGIYTFTDHVEELAEVSTDRAAARRAITRLHAAGRTALFDSISQLALLMDKRPGKNVIVVLTDGGDNASALNRDAAVNRAKKAGIPVFAVAQGEALHDRNASGLLHQLAEATGGRMYKAEKPGEIGKVFVEITADLQTSYLLAFVPPSEAQPPAWHELKVSVRNTASLVKVRSRTAYAE